MPYQEQDPKIDNWKYIEVWVEVYGSHRLPHILLLVCISDNEFKIVDPYMKYAAIHTTTSYQEAAFWLAEDEYIRMLEKITPDGGIT